IDPATPATLYTVSFAPIETSIVISKSTDGGNTWSAVNTDLPRTGISALVIDPTIPTTLYAGTNGSGVFKSTNGGSAWSTANTGLPGSFPVTRALAIAPTTPTTLYAGTFVGTESDLFKSTNEGSSWSAVHTGLSLNDTYIVALAIDPNTPTT